MPNEYEFVSVDTEEIEKLERMRRMPSLRLCVDQLTVEEYVKVLDQKEEKERLRKYKACRKLIEDIDVRSLGVRELHLFHHIIDWFSRKKWLARSQVVMLTKLSKGYAYHQILPIDNYGNEIF